MSRKQRNQRPTQFKSVEINKKREEENQKNKIKNNAALLAKDIKRPVK
jgi:hypothetical protein